MSNAQKTDLEMLITRAMGMTLADTKTRYVIHTSMGWRIEFSPGDPALTYTILPRMKYWMGDAPTKCDLNPAHPIASEFIDGATKMGPWANMCPTCHRRDGRGLGTGLGQKYTIQPNGKWLKTGG